VHREGAEETAAVFKPDWVLLYPIPLDVFCETKRVIACILENGVKVKRAVASTATHPMPAL
jgi:hypothetical protein